MSENIPESIPTSADPRSKRPVKKRAISPRSSTAQTIEALFKKPDQEIRIPSSSTALGAHHGDAPPEIVANVQGSSAGAGSGEFHVYKASRRREYERLRAMDEEVRSEEMGEVWERERREKQVRDEEKTRRNRERREKLKRGKGKKGGGDANGIGNVNVGGGIKARVEAGAGTGSNGVEESGVEEPRNSMPEPVGLIIHDDDD